MAPPAPLVALVLCGGSGTRLWPASIEQRPKQFLRLLGEHSLFQATCLRLAAAGADETLILTNAALEAPARADHAVLGLPPPRFVLEPARRDSGPAIAAGVADILARHGPDALVLVVASDHLIPDQAAFAASIRRGADLARLGYLVTFGIRPGFAATEYGYIQRGAPITSVEGGFAVRHFHEKPVREVAERYVADPDFAWNSGNFLFPAGLFAEEAAAHMPDIWQAASAAVSAGARQGDRLELGRPEFEAARRLSIDFGLFERSTRVGTILADFAWSDIGGWQAVYAASSKDDAGNARRGPAEMRDCRGSLVFTEGLPVYLIGLEDMVVVAGPNGVLVAPRARAQEIKTMLEAPPPPAPPSI